MIKLLCTYLLMSADLSALLSCSYKRWGEEEMPDALKKLNEN